MDDAEAPHESLRVSITRGLRSLTGIRGDGRAVVSADAFTLYDGADQQIAWAPLYQVRADYTRFARRSTVTVWVIGVRYVLSRGGPPSEEHVRRVRASVAAGANPAGAALRDASDQHEFTRHFHDIFVAAGGQWGRPPRRR